MSSISKCKTFDPSVQKYRIPNINHYTSPRALKKKCRYMKLVLPKQAFHGLIIRSAFSANLLMLDFLCRNKGKQLLEYADKHGRTPLLAAVNGYNHNSVTILLQNHANVNTAGTHGRTPIIEALARGEDGFVALKILLNHGAEYEKENLSESSQRLIQRALADLKEYRNLVIKTYNVVFQYLPLSNDIHFIIADYL
jgi:hypothetical protein